MIIFARIKIINPNGSKSLEIADKTSRLVLTGFVIDFTENSNTSYFGCQAKPNVFVIVLFASIEIDIDCSHPLKLPMISLQLDCHLWGSNPPLINKPFNWLINSIASSL